LKAAGVADQVTIVIGPAAESLTKLSPEEPFDLVFVDADKASNPIYFSEAKRLVRKGGVIVGLSLISFSTVLRSLTVT
jgi:predicted O-methyltransferase YrrM